MLSPKKKTSQKPRALAQQKKLPTSPLSLNDTQKIETGMMKESKKSNIKRKVKQKANFDIVDLPADLRAASGLEEIMVDIPLDGSYKPNDNTNYGVEGDDYSREDDFNQVINVSNMPPFEGSDRTGSVGQASPNRAMYGIKALDLSKIVREGVDGAKYPLTPSKTKKKKVAGLQKSLAKVDELMIKQKLKEQKIRKLVQDQQDLIIQQIGVSLKNPLGAPKKSAKTIKTVKKTKKDASLGKSTSAIFIKDKRIIANLASPGRAKAKVMMSPIAKKLKNAMALTNQNGQYSIGLVAKPGKRKSVLPGTVKKVASKKLMEGPDSQRARNSKTPLKSQVSYSTIKASTKNFKIPTQIGKAPGTNTSKKVKKRPNNISLVPSEFARSVVSASRSNVQFKKSKLIKQDSALYTFPSVAQMSTTPTRVPANGGSFMQDEDESKDSRAVILENQYLKNQVAALTKLVEEEKQNTNKERELRENMSQYSQMDNTMLNKTDLSPYDRQTMADKRSNYSQYGMMTNNTADERRKRFLQKKRELDIEQEREMLETRLKQKEDLRVKENIIQRNRQRSMDKISVAKTIKPPQNPKLDFGSFKIENFGTAEDDISDEQTFGSVHTSPQKDLRLLDKQRQEQLEEEKERLQEMIDDQKKQKDLENGNLKDQISTLKSQYVGLQEQKEVEFRRKLQEIQDKHRVDMQQLEEQVSKLSHSKSQHMVTPERKLTLAKKNSLATVQANKIQIEILPEFKRVETNIVGKFEHQRNQSSEACYQTAGSFGMKNTMVQSPQNMNSNKRNKENLYNVVSEIDSRDAERFSQVSPKSQFHKSQQFSKGAFKSMYQEDSSLSQLTTSMRKSKQDQASLMKYSQKSGSEFGGQAPTMSMFSSDMDFANRQVGATQDFIGMLQIDEAKKFGDRCPNGYQKIDLLGKGGTSIVWLAQNIMSGENYAVKQFPKDVKTKKYDYSANIELEFSNILFPTMFNSEDKMPDLDLVKYPGLENLSRLVANQEDSQDVWLIYELGSKTLSQRLCVIKGEEMSRKQERVYSISHQAFYKMYLTDKQILVKLVKKIAQALDVLQQFSLVHSDIKPDNVLIQLDGQHTELQTVKIVDFGSSFKHQLDMKISAATPEYLPPEVLFYLEQLQRLKLNVPNLTELQLEQKREMARQLHDATTKWSHDVWSLGIILVEIVTGYPVWLSLKCKMTTAHGKAKVGQGILGSKNRSNTDIIDAQKKFLGNIAGSLKKLDNYQITKTAGFMDLLTQMVNIDPKKRISPQGILDHQFCQD